MKYFIVFTIGFYFGAMSNHPVALKASYDLGRWIRMTFTGGS